MNLAPYDGQDDGKRVWLSTDEVEQLLATDALEEDVERRLAVELSVRSGLRSHEVVDVSPDDVVETAAGPMIRVRAGKGDKYRETPIHDRLAERVATIDSVRSDPSDEPVVSTTTRTLRRWIREARVELEEGTGDEGWRHLGFHDLRRTWASQLRSADVDAMVVCDWGGWDDLDTFLEHYRGTATPEAQRREREKVEWL